MLFPTLPTALSPQMVTSPIPLTTLGSACPHFIITVLPSSNSKVAPRAGSAAGHNTCGTDGIRHVLPSPNACLGDRGDGRIDLQIPQNSFGRRGGQSRRRGASS